MSERIFLNQKPGKADPKYRRVYQVAQVQLEGGQNCSDCEDIHSHRRAVAFVLEQAPPGAEVDFFVSFLCQMHADIFLLERHPGRETVITSDKSKKELIITDTKRVN
jgi:hypothetical protein